MSTIPIDATVVNEWSEQKLADEYALAVSGREWNSTADKNLIILEKELAKRRINSDKPPCQLTGQDGNVFSIIGRVSRTLKNAGLRAQSAEFCRRAMKSSKYEDVLTLCEEYVEVN